MNAGPTSLRARWVFPVSRPPIDGGIVTIKGGRIVSLGMAAEGPTRDLGDVALLPGLVNAHTHLEFSDLEAPLGSPGMKLPDWIRLVIGHRRANPSPAASAVVEGLRQSLAAGVTTVGEIATTDWRSAAELPQARPAVVMFHEVIGPTPARAQAAAAAAEAFLAAGVACDNVLPALSPHAPYTVHAELLAKLVAMSAKSNAPLAMHLAESPEELELLATASGPFRELLEAGGNWDASPAARLPRVLNYLQALSAAPRSLVIHGNYLDADEIAFLAAHRDTMSVVYCPRTHAYFGHRPYPLAEMLAAGVHLALGTDSRASNPDLSLFEELRVAAAHHPHVSPAALLHMATLGGAQALGFADRGALEPGMRADLAIVSLGDGRAAEPYEELFAESSRVTSLAAHS